MMSGPNAMQQQPGAAIRMTSATPTMQQRIKVLGVATPIALSSPVRRYVCACYFPSVFFSFFFRFGPKEAAFVFVFCEQHVPNSKSSAQNFPTFFVFGLPLLTDFFSFRLIFFLFSSIKCLLYSLLRKQKQQQLFFYLFYDYNPTFY